MAAIKGHPNKIFQRPQFELLNGQWEFAIGRESNFDKTIQVPYVCQSDLSGIGDKSPIEQVWYRRTFTAKLKKDERLYVHFGAVDNTCIVYVNGYMVGGHAGGYASFNFDITEHVKNGSNEIVVHVKDVEGECGRELVRGKQSFTHRERFSCFYTNVIGIWQSVWLEYVSVHSIEQVQFTPDITNGEIGVEVRTKNCHGLDLQIKISYEDQVVRGSVFRIDKDIETLRIGIRDYTRFPSTQELGLALWSPITPRLYDVELTIKDDTSTYDRINSYFGMRSVEIKGDKILFNGKDCFMRMLLHQGYYDGGIYTPDSDERFSQDVALIKAMGFNGVRMHQKMESPEFLYECDRQGLMVWQELPSQYRLTEKSIKSLTDEWTDCIVRDRNHPCITAYVPFNESWGVEHIRTDKREQSIVNAMYYLTKAVCPNSIVIGNDGWEHVLTDIVTIHDYNGNGQLMAENYADLSERLSSTISQTTTRYVFAENYRYNGQPIIISEFGGIALNGTNGWGYEARAHDSADLAQRIEKLIIAIYDMKISGFCYTQFTDVEQETNGLLTMKREPKIPVEDIAKIVLRRR